MLQIEKTKTKKTPHLALCHKDNGPANGRSVSLVMKSVDELSVEAKVAMNNLLQAGTESEDDQSPQQAEIEKASYQSKYRKLESAVETLVKEKDRWGWAYVRDFDDDYVIFSSMDGVFAATYSVDSDGTIVVDGDTIKVNEMISWEDDSGRIIVSQNDNISTTIGSLVLKSFDAPKADDDKLKMIFKSIFEEGKQMDELKSQNETLQAEVEKSKELVTSLEKQLKELQDAEAARVGISRKEVLKSVVAEGEVDAVFESLKGLDEAAFETVTKAMKANKEAAEQAEGLFTQVSKSGKTGEDATPTFVDSLTSILKEIE